MELQDYIKILRMRWVSILIITLLAGGAGLGLSMLTTPTYEARAQVFVSVHTGGSTNDLLQGSSFTQKQVKSYTDLTTSPLVLLPVIDELNLTTTPDLLAESIRADSPLDTVLINITASDTDPQRASDIANATADSLATQVTQLEKPDADASPVKISPVRLATPPSDPASPNTKLNVALGLLVGLALGVGLAVLREVLDTGVRSEADISHVTSSSIIGKIDYDEDAPDQPLIVQTHPHSLRAEAFRRLRTNLQFVDVAGRPQTIVVTSSLPGEGKSTTSINLAIALADSGARVILVDADLRRPSVAEYMGLEGSVGLTTVLIGRASIEDVVQPWGTGNLHVLPSGQIPPNPSELLGSTSMANLLDSLSSLYDIVLIDTPPLLPVTDAAVLSRITGGALVVVGANTVNRQQLAESMRSLETVGARVLGLVVNGLTHKKSASQAYYDYSPLPAEPTQKARSTSRGSSKASSTRKDPAPRQSQARSAPTSATRTVERTAGTAPLPEPSRVSVTQRRMAPAQADLSLQALFPEPEDQPRTWPGAPLS